MTPKRREKVMASLEAGNMIYRYWSGTNSSGYLSHRLEGVSRLRESEKDELLRERVIIHTNVGANRWGAYRLRTADDDAKEAEAIELREAQQLQQEAKEARRAELNALLPENVYVHSVKDKYDVTFHGLTEVEIRDLGARIKLN